MKQKPLKILFITFEYGKTISGGIGRVINSLAPLIAKQTDLHIMLLRNYVVYKFTIYKFAWIYKLCGDRRITKYRRFRPGMLIGLIRKEKYDLVHVFHSTGAAAVKTIKKRFPGLKVIYSCHSIAKHEFQIRNDHPDSLKHEECIVNYSDHLHLLNQSSLQYFQASYPAVPDQKSYSIIPNGIAADSFQEKDNGFKRKMDQLLGQNGKITVLCMSRWSWGKGLEVLLAAVPEVVAHYQNIQFVIAGRKLISWEYHYQDYLRKINSLIRNLNGYVSVLDWLNDRRRNTLFTFADIWVMPSLLEYFPYSILEPMMAKIPIISSRIDCVVEMLTDNRECLFYEPTSPQQLADKLLTLIHAPDLGKTLADNAYYKAQQYSWGKIADMYIKMYRDAL